MLLEISGVKLVSKTNKMNLKKVFTETKDVQTKLIRQVEEGKVIALQIDTDKILKEHISKVPAILICISGKAIYKDENRKIKLRPFRRLCTRRHRKWGRSGSECGPRCFWVLSVRGFQKSINRRALNWFFQI